MRRYIVAGLLLAGVAVAQDPFLKGDALAKEIADKCEDGCMTFSKQDMADLVQRVNLMIAEREAVAFRRGALSCRNAT